MRVRFSLRQLLGFVAFVAIGCGGLIRPSLFLASLIFTGTLVMLLVAILGAVGRTGSARVFWIGFAIAGSGYLWLAHWADEESYTVSTDWRLQTSSPRSCSGSRTERSTRLPKETLAAEGSLRCPWNQRSRRFLAR